MQAYIRFPQAAGTFRYWPYDGSALTVAQAAAAFALLTYDQRVASTTPNQPALASGFDRWKVRDTVVTDPEPNNLYGYPRTLMGTRNGATVLAGTGLNHLLEQYKGDPDTFAPKGGNLGGIVFAPGATLPSGLVDTDFYGQAPPPGFTKPDGYRLRYFGGNEDQKYYERSTLADETPDDTSPDDTNLPPVGSVGNTAIIRANSENMPIAVENNGTKWRVRKTGGDNITLLYINGERKSSLGGYDYLPGEQVSILAMFGSADPDNTNTWTYKAYYLITFGDISNQV